MKTDREKLINWIRYTYVSNPPYTYKATVDDIADAVIADMLIASGVVVREKGEWDTVLYEKHATISSFSHICPKCKYFYRDIRFKGHDFCPSCGSDMR